MKISPPLQVALDQFDPYPEYLTIEQAAAYLGVTPAQVRRLLRLFGLGDFTRAHLGKRVLISKQHLEALHVTREAHPAPARRTRGAA
ncbi:MAG TPA: helix-turn-helix domain-containing protein [Dehalococcoidia bacterium]|nr:helix-turn-helix domain-containing protein [Dehalococcoidia bacterium]